MMQYRCATFGDCLFPYNKTKLAESRSIHYRHTDGQTPTTVGLSNYPNTDYSEYSICSG